MTGLITDPDAFDSGDEAIEHAREHISETPLDEAGADALREELAMLEAVLDWEKPRHEWKIPARRSSIETALDHDHFDDARNSRKGKRYLDEQGSLVVLDGAMHVNEAIVTHYHYLIVGDSGEPDRPAEARETTPDDEDTHWIGVDELDAHLNDGTLRPAEVVPRDETVVDLVGGGLSPAEAFDYWGVEQLGYTQSDWAEKRGSKQPSVSENVSKARDKLGE